MPSQKTSLSKKKTRLRRSAVKLTKTSKGKNPKGRTQYRGAKRESRKIPELLIPPKGMHDVLPSDMPLWNKVIEKARAVAEFYDFVSIETPILEKTELFVRGVGETTDIVEKEMYTLRTKGGDKLALRPECTAPVVRSYLQHGMHRLPQPQRFYYVGPFFRHERPQSGRYRQFHQFGLEVLGGDSDPIYDAQIINAFYRVLESLKLKSFIVHINSIGCRVCRPGYQTKLAAYYKKQEVCRDCTRRVKENPLRLLDCKKEECQPVKAEAPSILNSLCSPCRTHLKQVLEYLEEVNIPYMLDPFLARGFDYYSRTVFEVFIDQSDLAVVAGGRYDYLAEMLGGRATSAAGAALGIERVVDILKEADSSAVRPEPKKLISLIHVGDLAKRKALPILEEFRRNSIPVTVNFSKNSLSSQLELANKKNSSISLILGQKEVYEESIIIRDMETGVQESVPIKKVVGSVKKKLRS